LVLTGQVALEAAVEPNGANRELIQTINAGDVIGWSWLFPPYEWNFAARAVEPTSAIIFFAANLRKQCDTDPKLGYELMTRVAKVVITRLQATRLQLLESKKARAA
jgi:CRP/FNR family cyclic AMP-dependent transcriptional regulator